MGVAPMKIIFVVILYFEVALVSSSLWLPKKVNKQVQRQNLILQSKGINETIRT